MRVCVLEGGCARGLASCVREFQLIRGGWSMYINIYWATKCKGGWSLSTTDRIKIVTRPSGSLLHVFLFQKYTFFRIRFSPASESPGMKTTGSRYKCLKEKKYASMGSQRNIGTRFCFISRENDSQDVSR